MVTAVKDAVSQIRSGTGDTRVDRIAEMVRVGWMEHYVKDNITWDRQPGAGIRARVIWER